MTMPLMMSGDNGLNEVQLPKELQRLDPGRRPLPALASMKCSSRRNCNGAGTRSAHRSLRASMKCSSRRNCNTSITQMMLEIGDRPQ